VKFNAMKNLFENKSKKIFYADFFLTLIEFLYLGINFDLIHWIYFSSYSQKDNYLNTIL